MEKYEAPVFEIIEFGNEDIITASGDFSLIRMANELAPDYFRIGDASDKVYED